MPDREKYIEVLSKTAKAVKELNEDAPIKISLECIEDILELLKEQGAVKPKSKTRHGEYPQIVHRCGNCNEILYRHYKHCPSCGRSVKWDD